MIEYIPELKSVNVEDSLLTFWLHPVDESLGLKVKPLRVELSPERLDEILAIDSVDEKMIQFRLEMVKSSPRIQAEWEAALLANRRQIPQELLAVVGAKFPPVGVDEFNAAMVSEPKDSVVDPEDPSKVTLNNIEIIEKVVV